ncbi:MAG TPA: hypothetical protein P5559_04725 [Candidatus Limiplasma sp.]|nr:hypothetical protein [Candidatus Limiplasma sp.]
MKRKSTMILIAALVLAIAIPAFALAAGGPRSASNTGMGGNGRYLMTKTSGTAIAPQGNQFALGDYLVDEDGFCYVLDENGDQQRVYSHGANGEFLYLQLQDGEYCWSDGTPLMRNTQTQLSNGFGGRGARWN